MKVLLTGVTGLIALGSFAACAGLASGCGQDVARKPHTAAATSTRPAAPNEAERQPQNLTSRPLPEVLGAGLAISVLRTITGDGDTQVPWTEVVLSLENRSKNDVEIERIAAVDSRGAILAQLDDRAATELVQRRLRERYSAAAARGGSALKGVANAGMSVVGAFVPGANLAMTGLGALFGGQKAAAGDATTVLVRESRNSLERFQKQQLNVIGLTPGGVASGSAFFAPHGSSPTELVVYVRRDAGTEKVRVPLQERSESRATSPQ